MSVSNRVFHAPRSDMGNRGYLRDEGCFSYLWRRGRAATRRVALMRALFFFTLITMRDRRAR